MGLPRTSTVILYVPPVTEASGRPAHRALMAGRASASANWPSRNIRPRCPNSVKISWTASTGSSSPSSRFTAAAVVGRLEQARYMPASVSWNVYVPACSGRRWSLIWTRPVPTSTSTLAVCRPARPWASPLPRAVRPHRRCPAGRLPSHSRRSRRRVRVRRAADRRAERAGWRRGS
jgi:hypothetical protein